jgi:hypothetical protein
MKVLLRLARLSIGRPSSSMATSLTRSLDSAVARGLAILGLLFKVLPRSISFPFPLSIILTISESSVGIVCSDPTVPLRTSMGEEGCIGSSAVWVHCGVEYLVKV